MPLEPDSAVLHDQRRGRGCMSAMLATLLGFAAGGLGGLGGMAVSVNANLVDYSQAHVGFSIVVGLSAGSSAAILLALIVFGLMDLLNRYGYFLLVALPTIFGGLVGFAAAFGALE